MNRLNPKQIARAHGVSARQARRIAKSASDWRAFRRTESEPDTKAEIFRARFVAHLTAAAQLHTSLQRCLASQAELMTFVDEQLSASEISEFLGPDPVGLHIGAAVTSLLAGASALRNHLPELVAFDVAKRLSGCPYPSSPSE